MILILRTLVALFFSFFLQFKAFACEDDGKEIIPFYDEANTKTVFVGRISELPLRKIFITVEKSWISQFDKYAVDPHWKPCFNYHFIRDGKSYLFISNRKIENNTHGLTRDEDFFIELEDAQPFIDKLALKKKSRTIFLILPGHTVKVMMSAHEIKQIFVA